MFAVSSERKIARCVFHGEIQLLNPEVRTVQGEPGECSETAKLSLSSGVLNWALNCTLSHAGLSTWLGSSNRSKSTELIQNETKCKMRKVQDTPKMHLRPLTYLLIYFRWVLTFTWALSLFTYCAMYWKYSSSVKFLFPFFLSCSLSTPWALMDK